METKYYTKEQKVNMKKSFLFIPKKFKAYLNNKNLFWIYKIINTENSKTYIGKTVDINRRSLDYINEYCKGFIDRKINKAIVSIGIEKFLMIPLEIAYSNSSASIKEKYYIDLYDAINDGYNNIMGSSGQPKNKRHTVVKQTIYSKMAKSKIICALNPNTKEIIFSTGLKLFGDYIGRHKDEIKSAARRETKMDGYFLFYMNKEDLESQLNNACKKIEKNSIYSDCNLQYKDFVKYANYIIRYLKVKENDEKFNVLFLTQSNEELGYEFKDINLFLNYYNTLQNKIY